MTERDYVTCSVIIMLGAVIGGAAGVLAAWWLSQAQPDNVVLGALLGTGGVVAGTLAGSVFAVRRARRHP